MSEEPIRAGVVGTPIAHSLSPLIHGEWLRRSGIEGRYDAIEVAAGYDAFATAMDNLRGRGFAGVNVTLPHKENAINYATHVDDKARLTGAANTLLFDKEKVTAFNTDIEGFAYSLEVAGVEVGPAFHATILGAGGAVRGILAALIEQGCRHVTLVNRTRDKAEQIASDFSSRLHEINICDWSDRVKAMAGADLLVNATSLGMTGKPALTIDLNDLKADAAVADIVYSPLKTPLLAAAEARGLKTVDGLGMLMGQAVHGFTAWFGATPQVDDDLRALLIAALTERGQI